MKEDGLLIVEDLTQDESIGLDAIDKVRRAEQLLLEAAPLQARWVQRYLRRIYVMNLKQVQIRPGRGKNFVLAASVISSCTTGDLALVLLYLAVMSRLSRFNSRVASADRRSQYWQRVKREVMVGARRLDHFEDPGGYVPGVSTGRWELWVDRWLGKAGIRQPSIDREMRDLYRDLRHSGAPRWIARRVIAYHRWRLRRF